MPTFKKGDRVRLINKKEFDYQHLEGHDIQIGDVVTVTEVDTYDPDFRIDRIGPDGTPHWWFRPMNFELANEPSDLTSESSVVAIKLPTLTELYQKLSSIPDPKLSPLEASRSLGALLQDLEDALTGNPEAIVPAASVMVSADDDNIGRKVVRGRDWKWGDQDEDGVGEIYSKAGAWGELNVYVRWGSGTTNSYRGGPDKFDLYYLS